jgi:hypothetical protein
MSHVDQKITAVTDALKLLFEEEFQEVSLANIQHVEFKAGKEGNVIGKGLIWTGTGLVTKQFITTSNPDRIFSTESIDLAKDKNFSINNVVVLNEKELGPTVTKSNLKELGRLKGLIVDGDLQINQYLFYDASMDRLGLGTDTPNAMFSILENGVEVMLGTTDHSRGAVGTYASNDFDIVTDNTPRISVSGNGDIELGNRNYGPSKVTVNGKLGVNVSQVDPRVDLQVSGAVKFNNTLHLRGTEPPSGGNHSVGDIVWNSQPSINSFIGWVCIQSGIPGQWLPFGQIQPS